jgi:phage repressor protein C with HTH and peptisase S24 domain
MNMIERIKQKMSERGLEQKDLVTKLGVSKGTISNWLNDKNKGISEDSLEQLARILRTTPSYLRYGVESEEARGTARARGEAAINSMARIDAWDSDTPLGEDEVELPLFREVELSGGHGSTMVQENHGAKLRFAKSTLRKKGIDESVAACCFVTGDSMLPILPHGSTVGVDKSSLNIVDGNIYAIDHGGLLRVKYLYRIPGGGVRIRSANRDHYPDEDLTPDQLEHFRVIGRVFWYSVLL